MIVLIQPLLYNTVVSQSSGCSLQCAKSSCNIKTHTFILQPKTDVTLKYSCESRSIYIARRGRNGRKRNTRNALGGESYRRCTERNAKVCSCLHCLFSAKPEESLHVIHLLCRSMLLPFVLFSFGTLLIGAATHLHIRPVQGSTGNPSHPLCSRLCPHLLALPSLGRRDCNRLLQYDYLRLSAAASLIFPFPEAPRTSASPSEQC